MADKKLLSSINKIIETVVLWFFGLFGVDGGNKYVVWIIQFIKFNIVGLLNFLITTIVYFALRGLPYVGAYAYVIGYALGIVNSYICNKLWTFESKDTRTGKETALFLIVSLIALGLSQGVKYLLESSLGVGDIIAYFVSLLLALAINYFGSKFIVFKK